MYNYGRGSGRLATFMVRSSTDPVTIKITSSPGWNYWRERETERERERQRETERQREK